MGAKLASGGAGGFAVVVGRDHTWAKLIVMLAFAAVLFLIFAKGNYRARPRSFWKGRSGRLCRAFLMATSRRFAVEVSDAIKANETSLAELDTASCV